ncbi:MAG: pyridoxal-phosphate dependent enzyme [Gemmatimonadaceae bacterium]
MARLPRASLLAGPTPVERSGAADALWIKRDDLSAEPLGGNKPRPLEWLLGGVSEGDTVLTVGAWGSTHALATAVHGARLGARVEVIRWPQEMHPVASAVKARTEGVAARVTDAGSPVAALLRTIGPRLGRRVHWVPPGGSSPRGALGAVNAAFELLAQVDAGLLPRPARVVVPLGTGGTAAGLALGFAIARAPVEVVAVRVVPRVVANAWRLHRLAGRTAELLSRVGGAPVPGVAPGMLRVDHGFFGGAYGRPLAAGEAADARFRSAHPGGMLDPTYGAKAFAAALARCDGRPTLFWVTFDARWLAAPT